MDKFDVLIIGAGFSGLGMAIQLRQAGIESFHHRKSERHWRNLAREPVPRLRCGIPSHLYSFSFDSNPDWSRMYPRQQEIQDYLKRCAERYGIVPHDCLVPHGFDQARV
jgi:cation diffusion facilitator CzcD-associated flavoprotein CzcO